MKLAAIKVQWHNMAHLMFLEHHVGCSWRKRIGHEFSCNQSTMAQCGVKDVYRAPLGVQQGGNELALELAATKVVVGWQFGWHRIMRHCRNISQHLKNNE